MPELEPRVLSSDRDYDELVERIAAAKIVMLGAASHGTEEFYSERCRITKRLIEEHGFKMLAAVTDWADAYRVNRYVQGAPEDPDPEQALGDFCRFPTWVFRNREMLDFVAWLRAYNERTRYRDPVALHGLDLYSFFQATARVIKHLDLIDPDAAERARDYFAQLGHLDMEPGHSENGGLDIEPTTRRKLLEDLIQLRLRAQSYLQRDGTALEDAEFYTEQHTRLAANAERYYRVLLSDRAAAWRQREQHMAETLSSLVENLKRRGADPKVVVWGHNSHVGDARLTEHGERGEISLGQLARERWPSGVALVGFTNYAGMVTASSTWGGDVRRMRVRPALEGSHEAVLHRVGEPRFYIKLGDAATGTFRGHRPQRGIGTVYRPETEFANHFFSADIAGQFDAVVHIDEAKAVEPLDRDGWANETASALDS